MRAAFFVSRGEKIMSAVGALGTPSSGVMTHLTGTPASIGLANGSGLPIAGISGLGTGVNTALGTNVGSAGLSRRLRARRPLALLSPVFACY
jgi:hypothetical protein